MARNRIVDLANFPQFTAINILSDPGHIGGPKVIPSCAEIVLHWLVAGAKSANNVLICRYTGTFAGTVAQANAIMTALATGAPAAALATHLATTTSLANILIRDLNTANQGQVFSSVPGITGSGVGSALPNEVALVVTEHTALTGTANRGRMFIPGWATATVAADNTAVAAVVTDLQAWANTVQNALNGSGYTLVVGHPARQAYTGRTGTAHPARPAGSVTVQSLFVRDNHWDSQRRRGLK
jgi:hypothetical protein